jgi:hypothetical protein
MLRNLAHLAEDGGSIAHNLVHHPCDFSRGSVKEELGGPEVKVFGGGDE